MGIQRIAVRGRIALALSIVIALPLAAGSVPKAVAQDEATHEIMGCHRSAVITELNNGGPGGRKQPVHHRGRGREGRYKTSLDNESYGALLCDKGGKTVDAVAV